MKTGIELIAEERQRQIEVKGWTSEHDDEHADGQLALAASVYAEPLKFGGGYFSDQRTFRWPWEPSSFKPTPENRVRELVKAGALIAAEIDRLNRKEPHPHD